MIKPNRPMETPIQTESGEKPELHYSPVEKPHWGERLARNLALAGMLLLTVTAVRNAELPSGATVLTAVQEMIDTDWDEHLGKISFVSNMLPESVAVFFQSPLEEGYTAPCFGTVSHPWSQDEPYLGYSSADNRVFAIGDGQVMSVAHGLDEELILRVRHENGVESMYYNLASIRVTEGETVSASTCLGQALPEGALVEIRRAGRAVDPSAVLSPRLEGQP